MTNILDHCCRLSLTITLATILITNFLKCHIKGGGRPGGGEVQDQAGLRRPQRCLQRAHVIGTAQISYGLHLCTLYNSMFKYNPILLNLICFALAEVRK